MIGKRGEQKEVVFFFLHFLSQAKPWSHWFEFLNLFFFALTQIQLEPDLISHDHCGTKKEVQLVPGTRMLKEENELGQCGTTPEEVFQKFHD